MTAKTSKLQAYYSEVSKPYGVQCKVFTRNKYVYSDKKDRYVVFSPHKIPDDLNVKQIYVRNERSNMLFYTDYHVVKIDEDTSMLGLVASATNFCKTVEFLKKIFAEFKTPLPKVIRGDEIGGLKEFNQGRKNKDLPPEGRADFQKGLQKFFKQENSRSKYAQKWRAFSRTDKYDRKASFWKMFRDFYRRDSQIVDLNLLHETNDDLNSTLINEHEFVKFKEEMKRLHPDVLYSVSEVEVQNEGFDVKRNKNKPIDKIKRGPSGKLVTFQAYCEECEKRFATEGYPAILDLTPAYYETRQLYYKEIDEPFVASVLNSIRFAYAKSNNLQRVQVPGTDIVSYIDMPVDDMMNFVSLAKANNVSFHLDFSGRFGKANFEKLRVVYSPMQDEMMHSIVERLIKEKCEFDHIQVAQPDMIPLERRISEARHVQISEPTKKNDKRRDKGYQH